MKRIIPILCKAATPIAIAIAIAIAIGAVTAAPALAAEPENTLVLSFSEIEGLVTKGNLAIRNNDTTIINLSNSTDVDEMIFALSSSYNSLDAMAREARALQRQIMNSIETGEPDPVREGLILALKSDISAYERDMAQILAQLDQLFESPRPTADRAIAQLGNANKLIVSGAESLFMGCHALTRRLEQSNGSLKALASDIRVMELRHSRGLITERALLGAKSEYAGLELGVKALENDLKSLHGQINLILGRDQAAPLQIGALPAARRGFLKAADKEKDLLAAKNNNHLMTIAKIDIAEQSRQSSITAKRLEAIAKNNLDSEAREVELRYDKLAKAIEEHEAQLALAENRLALSRRVMEETAKRHELGIAPRIALEQAEGAVHAQTITVKAADAELFAAIRGYEWLLRGVNA